MLFSIRAVIPLRKTSFFSVLIMQSCFSFFFLNICFFSFLYILCIFYSSLKNKCKCNSWLLDCHADLFAMSWCPVHLTVD